MLSSSGMITEPRFSLASKSQMAKWFMSKTVRFPGSSRTTRSSLYAPNGSKLKRGEKLFCFKCRNLLSHLLSQFVRYPLPTRIWLRTKTNPEESLRTLSIIMERRYSYCFRINNHHRLRTNTIRQL